MPLPAGAARERHGRDRLAHGVGPTASRSSSSTTSVGTSASAGLVRGASSRRWSTTSRSCSTAARRSGSWASPARASPRSRACCSGSTSRRRAASTSTRPTSSASPCASCGGAARCRSSSRPVCVAEQAKDGRADRLVPAHRPRTLTQRARSARVAELLEPVGLRPEHASAYPRQLWRPVPARSASRARLPCTRSWSCSMRRCRPSTSRSRRRSSTPARPPGPARPDLPLRHARPRGRPLHGGHDRRHVLGRIVEEGPRDSLFRGSAASYTHALLACPTGAREVQYRLPRGAPPRRAAVGLPPTSPLPARPARALPDGRSALHATAAGTVAASLPPVGTSLLAEVAREPGERCPPLGRLTP